MCMTSQSFSFTCQTQPIGQLLRGSPVLSGEGVRLIVRSYFVSRWIYERTGARHAPGRLRTHVEAKSVPSLGV
jgi:hypothetical protein